MEEERGPLKGKGPGKQPAGTAALKGKVSAAKPTRGRKAAPARKEPPRLEEEKELKEETPGAPPPPPAPPLSLQCFECHITFTDPKCQERHLKKRHPAEYERHVLGGSLFTCYVCDCAFPSSRELLAHQRGHTEERPFQCPVCGARFGRSSELTAHKKTHFGQLGYACADCGKLCKTLTLLKYHRRTHTGERPYRCLECGRTFKQSSGMQRHLQTHAEEQGAGGGGGSGKEKPQKRKRRRRKGEEEEEEEERAVPTASLEGAQCSQCLLTFSDPQTAEQHVRSQHPEVPPPPSAPPGSAQHSQGSLPPCGETGYCVGPGLGSGGGEEGEMQAAVSDVSLPTNSSTICPLPRQPCDPHPNHCSSDPQPPPSLTEPPLPLPLALSRETSRRFCCQVCGERFYEEPCLQQHQRSNQHWREPGQNQSEGAGQELRGGGGGGEPPSELSLQGCPEESQGGNRTSGLVDGAGFEGRGAEIEEGRGEACLQPGNRLRERRHGLGEAMGILERGPQLGSAEEGGGGGGEGEGGGQLQGVQIQGAELRESGGGVSEREARGEAASEGVKQEGEREEGETPVPGLEVQESGPQGPACDLGVEAARRAVMKEEEEYDDQQPVYCEILPVSEPSRLGSGEPEEGDAEVKKEETSELGGGCFYLGTPELRFFHLPDLQEQRGSIAGGEWGAAGSGAGFGRRRRPGTGARGEGEGEGEGVALVVLRQEESDSALGRLHREGEPPQIKEEEEEEEEGVFFSLSSVLEQRRENQQLLLGGSPTRTPAPELGAPSPGRPLEVEEGRGGLIKQEEEESVGLLGSFFPSSSSSSSSASLQLVNHHGLVHILPGPDEAVEGRAGGEGVEGGENEEEEVEMVVSVFQLKEEEEEELALDAARLGSPGQHPPLPVSGSSSSLGGAVLEGRRGVELNGGSSVETGESGRGVLEMEGGLVLLGCVKQEEGEREGGEAALMTEEEEEERGASQQSLSLPVEHLDRADPLPGLEQMEREPHAPVAGSGGDPGAGGTSGGSSPRGQESRAGRAGARRELRRGPGSKGSREEEEEEGERQRGREADCADGGSDRDAGQTERPQRLSGVCVTEASRETGGLSSRRKKPPLQCQQEELLDSLARSSEVEEDSDRSDSEVEGEAAVLARYSPAGDPSEEEEEEEEEQHANDAEPAAHQWKKTSAQSALLFQDQGAPSLPPLRSAPLSPSQYFRQYFSWELWESVAQQSSSRQAGGAAGRVSARDVCVFIGANIVMGTLKLPSLKLYWSSSTRIPMISERISRERFSALGSTLRVSGGEGEAGGRLWRVGPALESVRRACRRLPRETVCAVTERIVPLTPKHRGGGGAAALRVSLLLGGASGLVLDLQLGGGPLSRADTVAQLAETIPGDGGHVLLLPRAAPRTLELLLRGGVRSSGAVEGGRLGGLAGELLGAGGGGEREAVVRGDGRVALVRCRGRVFASTCLAGEPPGGGRGAAEAMARERRLFEETVGRQGALGELYGAPSPWRRWGVTVLLYLVDLALLNSWLEYRQDDGSRRGISLMAFRMQVAEDLLRSGAKPESRARKRPGSEGGEEEEGGGVEMKRPALSLPLPPSPAAELRYDGADHWPEQLERAGGCGFESCSRTTSVSCIKCRVFLCITTRDNCFLKFHNK